MVDDRRQRETLELVELRVLLLNREWRFCLFKGIHSQKVLCCELMEQGDDWWPFSLSSLSPGFATCMGRQTNAHLICSHSSLILYIVNRIGFVVFIERIFQARSSLFAFREPVLIANVAWNRIHHQWMSGWIDDFRMPIGLRSKLWRNTKRELQFKQRNLWCARKLCW